MNKITKEFLESEIISVECQHLSDRLTHCTITVKNGFEFTGESVCVDTANYNEEVGNKIAYKNAFDKMWMPYGFMLRQKMFDDSALSNVERGDKDDDYQLPDGATFDFGVAVEALKQGARVARVGWNGKGMFLYYVPENKYPASRNEHGTMVGVFEDDMVPYGAYIAMKTAQNNVVPWLASQTDVLADDWVIVE